MKKYKVITEHTVFCIGKEFHNLKKGDTVELDENHITVRALVEKKCLVEVQEKEQEKPEPKAPKTHKKEQIN